MKLSSMIIVTLAVFGLLAGGCAKRGDQDVAAEPPAVYTIDEPQAVQFDGVVRKQGDRYYIEAVASERSVLKLQSRQGVSVYVYANGKEMNGTIKDIKTNLTPGGHHEAVAGELTGQSTYYPVQIEIGQESDVIEGLHVAVTAKSVKEKARVPKTAVKQEEGAQYIWVVQDGKLAKAKVQTRPWNDRYDEVVAGVSFGDRIIRDASGTYKEGDTVEAAGS